jgi:hypothetical protein
MCLAGVFILDDDGRGVDVARDEALPDRTLGLHHGAHRRDVDPRLVEGLHLVFQDTK